MPTPEPIASPSAEEAVEFIRDTFRSVWSIEVLGQLRAHVDRTIAEGDLVREMRASLLVVRQSLESLMAAGLVSIHGDDTICYAPATPRLGALADAALEYYRKNPDAARRVIVAALNPGATAFAAAFKLRKD
ncbi:hypothetical protein [Novosphingobium sp. Gsoil 351]|uniref:hypothetical protein n=1 Tax=Novosphingobium sp. Gsoil 351 TaxID=2675225 RepID=UPI0012B445E1|nr:hypothetical protein [Novosphingobium sp. Gsoil 351]QGN54122.1 hypothetical protein GKE62_05745 [Novosphingobium sp. Gsoil 351]